MPLTYTPLNQSDDEIRLLTLHRYSQDGKVTCTMATRSLGRYAVYNGTPYDWEHGGLMGTPIPQAEVDSNTVPDYEALSYTWNPTNPTHEIVINGEQVTVGNNLYQALYQLSQTTSDRVLWIDALCINQDDLEERSAQVRRMRKIYQRARGVVIWLGEADSTSDLAFDTLERVCGTDQQRADADRIIRTIKNPEYDYETMMGTFSGDPEEDARIKKEIYRDSWAYMDDLGLSTWSDIDQKGQEALETLLHREYWTRVWCVQEVAMAHDLTMHCGTRSIKLDCVKNRFFSPSRREGLKEFFTLLDDSSLHTMSRAREFVRSPFRSQGFTPMTPFHMVLDKYRNFTASDPRDKVYALLGLPSADEWMPLEVDYTKSIEQVYTNVARTIIDWTRDLSLLTLPKSDENSALNLPTWVPDWSLPRPEIDMIQGSCATKEYPVTGQDFPDLTTQNETELLRRRLHRADTDEHNDTLQTKRHRKSASLSRIAKLIRSMRKSPKKTPDTLGGKGSKPPLRRDLSSRGHGEHEFRLLLADRWTAAHLKGSLVERPQPASSPYVSACSTSLHIEIIPLRSISWVGIPPAAVDMESSSWKDNVRSWHDEIVVKNLAPLFGDHTKDIHMNLFRNSFGIPGAAQANGFTEPWVTVYHEEFLMLLEKLPTEQLTHPDLHKELSGADSYENQLKRMLKGWIPALVEMQEGIHDMVMVPTQCQIGDKMVLAFGADTPLILRPVDAQVQDDRWTLVGPAFWFRGMDGSIMRQCEHQGANHSLWPEIWPCELV